MGDETATNESSQNKEGSSTNTANFHGAQGFAFQGAHIEGANFYFGQQESKDKTSDSTGPNPAREDQEKSHEEANGKEESQQQTITDKWFISTGEFGAPRGIRPHFDEAELLSQFNDFETNKLIFITCADAQMAKSGAYSLMERLNFVDAQKRVLDFGRTGKEICEITPLLQGEPGTGDLAVVVDLFNPKAEQFFYSLIDTVVHSSDNLCEDLKRARIYLLCVAYAADLSAKLNLLDAPTVFAHDHFFPYWKISFLESLLQHHYPENYKELAARISERRSWWDPDERVFCQQLKMLIQEGKLFETLQKPLNVETPFDPQSLFTNQDALIDTVVYAGTFFTDLKPREFDHVVKLLLGSKTKTVTVSTVNKNANGTSEQVQVEQEKPLVELWQQSMDRIKAECFLTAFRSQDDAPPVVSFRNHQFQESLRGYLRSTYPSFMHSQLEQLMDAGVLFDSSEKVAINLVKLVAEVAVTDPEYLEEWFESLLDEVEPFFASEADSIRVAGPVLNPLASLNDLEAQTRLCRRIALLIQRMLEDYHLNDMASGLLEQIMRRHLFLQVLEIVKALRFTAEFDEFHWFKQLIERGDAECREKTVLSLSYRMRNIGPRVYQMLRKMDAWVKVDPPLASYSRSGREAVWLLIDFCSETTVYRPLEQYGLWPSSHPLFRFADAQSAIDGLKLLSRWLFHPWMRSVISERFTPAVNYSIGSLVAEWIFILLKPSENSAVSSNTEQAKAETTPSEVADILIQQLAAASAKNQQSELLEFWELYSASLLTQIQEMAYADGEGSVRIWKRNLLNDLIIQFKAAAYEQEVVMTAEQT